MTHARTRTAVAVLAVTAALGTLAGCGGGGSKASGTPGHPTAHRSTTGGNAVTTNAVAQLRLAATKTDQADSAVVEGTTTINRVEMTMNGKLAWPHGMTGDVDIRMTGGPMAATMQQMGGNGSYEARYLTDAMYVNMGEAIAKSDGGKPWLKYDYDVLAKMLGASGSAMKEEFQNNNPTRSVQMLIASGDVRRIGQEDVRGVGTTHYAGTVDVAEIVGTQSGLDAATAHELSGQLKSEGVTTDRVDLWVDAKGLLVKKVEKADTANGAVVSTAYYSDYGVKVAVVAPPADRTMDVSELLARQQGSGTTS